MSPAHLGIRRIPRVGQQSPPAVDGGAGILFQSDWSTGLGSNDAALRDTNQTRPWASARGATADLDVVDSTGLGMPSAHCLRAKHPAGVTQSAEVMVSDTAETPGTGLTPAPSINDERYYRLYFRCGYTDAQALGLSNMHGIEDSSNAARTNFNWHWGNRTDGTFDLNFWHDGDPTSPTNYNRWYLNGDTAMGNLAKNHTYRLEWMIRIVSITEVTYRVRVYNESGTLLFPDGNGFTIMKAADGTDMYTYPHGTDATRIGGLEFLRLPKNGGPTYAQDEFYYIGPVMVRSNTWPGAYS